MSALLLFLALPTLYALLISIALVVLFGERDEA